MKLPHCHLMSGLPWSCLGALLFLAFVPVPADQPASSPLAVNVDWNTVAGQTTPTSYGIDGFSAFDPINAANSKYQSNLAYLGAGLIRFHSWEMISDAKANASGWLDVANKKWDADKIQASLAAFKGSKAVILINIPGFPSWFKTTDDMLDDSEVDAYADFCADLVRIVNVQNNDNVGYWEITNERDDPYWNHPLQNNGTPHIAALAHVFNECARAMKAVDPTIKTGGPAAARPDYLPQLSEFVKDVLPNLDFFSIHAYASGSASDSDSTIFDRAKGFGDRVSDVRKMLDAASPDRHIPIQLNEYNISWTWQTQDVRMKNYMGAVFDAIALTSMAKAGAETTCAWNDRDGVYGKMDGDYNLRPSANVFHLLNSYGVGNIAATTASDPSQVIAFAVQDPTSGSRLLLLINEAPTDCPLSFNLGNWSGQADQYSLDKDGYRTTSVDLATLANGYTLPGHSLVAFVTADHAAQK